MQKKHLLTLVLFFTAHILFAQRPYYNERPEFLKANSVWAFGDSAGLDFNYNPPLPFKTSMSVPEGCASVADPETGNLLFYSDGRKVWNAHHDVMPNGDSLYGNSGSGTQNVCIVPVIGSSGKYYLFSMKEQYYAMASPPAVFYSIVDMSLANGRGDVDTAQKNVPLVHSSDILSESMIAIPGNNCDIWLLLHDYQKPVFRAYNISEQGIDTTPIISHVGHQIQGVFSYSIGALAVSPDRSMIAITNYNLLTVSGMTGVLIAKFNASTGEVSEAIPLDYDYCYGVCFSPDNSKLYVNYNIPFKTLVQYEVSNYDSAAVVSSMTAIEDSIFDKIHHDGMALSLLKLYDNKIYRSIDRSQMLTSVNAPNLQGKACNYDTTAIRLLPYPAMRANITLPNDVVFPFPPDTFYSLNLDTVICPKEVLSLQAGTDYGTCIWPDGDTGRTKTVDRPGTYWVAQSDGCHFFIDTFIVKFHDFPKPVINVNILELGIVGNFAYSGYQWLLNGLVIPSATRSTYAVHENGDYRVVVNNGYCTDTSDIYKVTNAETSVADVNFLAGQVKVFPNPAKDVIYITSPVDVIISVYSIEGRLMQTVEGVKQVDIQSYAAGVYFLKIYDIKGRLVKSEKVIK